jgi:hypothetical protein
VFTTPIIYVFFNRPDVTRRTFGVIRALRPKRLYLIADGPRPSRPADAERCEQTRAVVEGMIDWDCDVTRDYAAQNLGCGRRLSSGFTSAFAQLGEAIVLEDDVLPHPDFFPFCAEMLARYRDDPRVHAISGFNPIGRFEPAKGRAIPTFFNNMWGWASWQRSWKDYHFDISAWNTPATKDAFRAFVDDPLIYQWHAHNFDTLWTEKLDTWDFQWNFCMLEQQRLNLVSSVNFIENLGFDAAATHTTFKEPFFHDLRTHPAVATNAWRDPHAIDRLHEKFYSEIVMTPSRRKIALLRWLAGQSWLLPALRRKTN